MDLQSLRLLSTWDGKESGVGGNVSCHQGTSREKRRLIVMCQAVLIILGPEMESAGCSGPWFTNLIFHDTVAPLEASEAWYDGSVRNSPV